MSHKATPSPADQRPAGNQFSLRGMFVLITAVSVILALLALAIQAPIQWLGVLGVIAFCLIAVGVLEGLRVLFPPQPRHVYYYPPLPPPGALQTGYFGDPGFDTQSSGGGESPFAPQSDAGESPFATRKDG